MVKTLKKLMTLKLGMHHRVLKKYQVCSSDDTGWTLTYFTARSNLISYAFVWEKGKTMDFSGTIVVWFETSNWWPKWQEVPVDIKTFSPWGCMPPAPDLYTCIKSWKKLYKIRLQRDFFETCNKWVKWQGLSVDIKILSPGGCLLWGYKHVLNHDFKDIF